MVIAIAFQIPLEAQVYTNDFPLTVDFIAANDDGENITIVYVQGDDGETLTKQRTIEVIPPYLPVADAGRNFLGIMSNNLLVFENTETTLPDRRVRDS